MMTITAFFYTQEIKMVTTPLGSECHVNVNDYKKGGDPDTIDRTSEEQWYLLIQFDTILPEGEAGDCEIKQQSKLRQTNS